MPAAAARRLVALDHPPGEEFVADLDRAWSRGDAVLPLDPRAPQAVTGALVDAMRLDLPPAEGTALVIATSGSTGEPKGVELSHAALDASARATHARIGLEPGDKWLSCLPWHHIGGIQVMLRARLLSIPLTVHDRFDVERFAGEPATLVSLVPTQLARLLDARADLARFRVILLGGAAASRALLDRARAAGAAVVTTYGMSETAGGCVYDGVPLDGVEIRLDDASRVRVRGPMLMSGYRQEPAATAAAFDDGWLVTSDLGEIDPAGRLRVIGRIDDVVVTGGENVATSAVAAVLASHPDIADVAVTGVDDERWGQRLVAVVVARTGAGETLSLTGIRDWCGDQLAAAAKPRGLVVVPAIPRLGSGKPDRRAITALVQGRLGDARRK